MPSLKTAAASPALHQSSPSAPVQAWLLVNLGTPTAPTARAVRAYLAEFLRDRRVVQLPRALWLPLLYGAILPLRSGKVAHKYASIWLDGGSPLAVHTQRLADAVQALEPQRAVRYAMRYGAPSIAKVLRELHTQGVRQVRVLPLYPQYSTTTTASVEDAVGAACVPLAGMRAEVVRDYHLHLSWAHAVAQSVRTHWQANGAAERLLFSYHGIPQRVVDAGDPYAAQCVASTRAIADALGIASTQIHHTYQSRFGREAWLQPYTLPTLQRLAGEGVTTVDIACPGFAVDCLETLEEIAVENARAFQAAGGQAVRYIPCLNASPAHARAIAEILREPARS